MILSLFLRIFLFINSINPKNNDSIIDQFINDPKRLTLKEKKLAKKEAKIAEQRKAIEEKLKNQ